MVKEMRIFLAAAVIALAGAVGAQAQSAISGGAGAPATPVNGAPISPTTISATGAISTSDGITAGTSLTVQGSAFSVGASSLVVASGRVGVGTTNPTTQFHVDGSSAGLYVTTNASEFYAGGGPDAPSASPFTSNSVSMLVGYGAGGLMANYDARVARGTRSAPTATLSGDSVQFSGRGHNGVIFSTQSFAAMSFVANETQTATNNGSRIIFQTTKNGTIVKVERLRITHDGKVGIGTTAPAYGFHVASDAFVSAGLIVGSTLTVQGAEFSVAGSTLVVVGGTVGIGTGTPAYQLHVNGADAAIRETSDNAGFYFGRGLGSPDASPTAPSFPGFLLIEGFASTTSGAATEQRISRGSRAAPTASQSGDLVQWAMRGYEGTTISSATNASMFFTMDQTQAPGANGSRITFQTTANNTVGKVNRMVIDDTGNISIAAGNAPSYRLHVVGDEFINGQSIVSGTMTVQGAALFSSSLVIADPGTLTVSSAAFLGVSYSTQAAGAAGDAVTVTCPVGKFAEYGGCDCTGIVAGTAIVNRPNSVTAGSLPTGHTCQISGATGGACAAFVRCSIVQ